MFNLFTVARPFTFADDTKLSTTLYTSEESTLKKVETLNNQFHTVFTREDLTRDTSILPANFKIG